MKCRPNCGMCCIAPSIKQPFYNMPEGKKAGQACANLDEKSFLCKIWETDQYPSFCRDYLADTHFCGADRQEAEGILTFLEASTCPSKG